jgi:hypothetical protein
MTGQEATSVPQLNIYKPNAFTLTANYTALINCGKMGYFSSHSIFIGLSP